MTSDRLIYEPLEPAQLDAFHRLVADEHVRRYLMDGDVFPREWSADRIRDSQSLFRRRGVGLWLAFDKAARELVGFCGFLEMPQIHSAPQIVYAMFERFTGKGYAVEMAGAAIAQARAHPGFERIVAAVDGVNVASLRVLEKLGFERIDTRQGAFGDVLVLQLEGTAPDVEGERRK